VAPPLVIDTDVLVDHLRGSRAAMSYLSTHRDRILLSSIVVAELLAGFRGETELTEIESLISFFRVVPVTLEIAKTAGLLKRGYGKSHGVSLPDAILAATAQHEKGELATLNVKHYPMFKNLAPAYTKS
jgi:predicted nucleic acid-binding protein